MKKGYLKLMAWLAGITFVLMCFGMSTLLSDGVMALNELPKAIGEIVLFSLAVPVAVSIYFLPSVITYHKHGRGDGLASGFVWNLLLGWMPVFWVIMVAMSWKN